MDLSGKYFRTYSEDFFLVHFVLLFFKTVFACIYIYSQLWLTIDCHTQPYGKEVLYQVKQRSIKEAERYNRISLHKCSIRGIPNPLFTNACMVFLSLLCCFSWPVQNLEETNYHSSSYFLTFNQCFLYCNMALVNLWKSDEVSSETLYPCFYCFTVREYA